MLEASRRAWKQAAGLANVQFPKTPLAVVLLSNLA